MGKGAYRNRKQPHLKFDVQKTIRYWLNGAKYDMETARALYEKARYPYALFMGHLALEKLLKAIVVKVTRQHAPYSHSLPLLASKVNMKLPRAFERRLAKFMEFHFEARYPDEQKKFYKKCTEKFTAHNMQQIEEVFTWLIENLEKK